jgi:hypothetical protein
LASLNLQLPPTSRSFTTPWPKNIATGLHVQDDSHYDINKKAPLVSQRGFSLFGFYFVEALSTNPNWVATLPRKAIGPTWVKRLSRSAQISPPMSVQRRQKL